jgi:hypothetical protein
VQIGGTTLFTFNFLTFNFLKGGEIFMPVTTVTSFSGDIQMGPTAPIIDILYINKYIDRLKEAAPLIKARLDDVIPNDAAYQARLVTPAVERFANVLNPAYVSDSGRTSTVMNALREAKLAKGYNKWSAGIEAAFATEGGIAEKKFKEAVQTKSVGWTESMSAGVIPSTGTGKRGKGPMVFIPRFLLDRYDWDKIIPAGWAHQDGFDIVKDGQKPQFIAAVSGLLVASIGAMWLVGSDTVAAAYINNQLKDTMNAFVDTTKANEFAAPDASPTSSLILSLATAPDVVHVACVIRTGTP